MTLISPTNLGAEGHLGLCWHGICPSVKIGLNTNTFYLFKGFNFKKTESGFKNDVLGEPVHKYVCV